MEEGGKVMGSWRTDENSGNWSENNRGREMAWEREIRRKVGVGRGIVESEEGERRKQKKREKKEEEEEDER